MLRLDRAAPDSAGFTLVELLVALAIGGVVSSVIFQLIVGQGRFVGIQSAREEVQQNTRAAIELIGSELRTLPPGGTLVRAANDSITIRSPRVWGVVCSVTSATTLDIVLPVVPGASYAVNQGTGLAVNLGTAAAPLWSQGVGVTTVGGAAATCGGSTLGLGTERRSFGLTATPQNGATTPAAGSIVFLYDQVTYRTGTSAGVPGLWIQRRLGEGGGTNQPLAGPIQEQGGGLNFSYFSGTSNTPLATPITDAAIRASVTRVRVAVESISRSRYGDTPQSKADTVVISLRNRV